MSVEILHADALWLRTLGVGADAMIVDPPYAARVHTQAVSARTGGAGVRKRDLGFDSLSPALMRRIAMYASQVRRWSLVYTDVESSHQWRWEMALAGVEYVRAVPWVRWTQPQLSGDRPPSGREEVLFFHRGCGVNRRDVPPEQAFLRGASVSQYLAYLESLVKPVRKSWNGPGNLTHLEHKALRATRGATADKHPTEKPLDQLLDLVSWLTDPGETVIDPCGGNGTTALAAALLGRSAIVLEQDVGWARGARLRVGVAETDRELCVRDSERVRRFVERACEEASRVPYPRKACERKTWERAQRRLEDVVRVVRTLEGTETA